MYQVALHVLRWFACIKGWLHIQFLTRMCSSHPLRQSIILKTVKKTYFINKIFLLFQSHTIENLETYTQYLVSLQVFNPEGPGPNTTVLVMTDEGGKFTYKMSS